MRSPWIEDAQRFKATADLSWSGLCQAGEIEEFLASVQSPRSVVMAPKGFGKTLLIKYKRKEMEKKKYESLPQNKLVDVAPGVAPPLGKAQIRLIDDNPEYWSMLWQIAISIAVIKFSINRFGDSISTDDCKAVTRSILNNNDLQTPFLIFARLVDQNVNSYFDLRKDFAGPIVSKYSILHGRIAVFIDNIDEYYVQHLKVDREDAIVGPRAQQYWHDAQIGLLMAIRQLALHNPHVKVFASIRSEAFNARREDLPDLANLRDLLLSVKFSPDDLREMFVHNIALEKASNLVDRTAGDPFERFFGGGGTHVRHRFTGRLESVFDYVLRHTLGRPRDLMHVGRELANLGANGRRTQAVRDSVNAAAADIARSYIGEASPHYAWFDQEILFRLLDSNVIDAVRCDEIAKEYDAAVAASEHPHVGGTGREALSDLYHSGLLGIVAPRPDEKKRYQKFESLYNCAGRRVNRRKTLPDADIYLVHPVLGSLLRQAYRPMSAHVDSANIIEPGATWIEDDGMKYILQGDVAGYSAIIRNPSWKELFPQRLRAILENAKNGVEYFEHHDGDAFAFVDRSGYLLVNVALQIANALRASMFKAEVRFGLDYGVVRVQDDGERLAADLAVQQSARLCGASAPGHILMPTPVRDELDHYDVTWPFFTLQDEGAEAFRARRVKTGWDVGKDDERDVVPSLTALPLSDALDSE